MIAQLERLPEIQLIAQAEQQPQPKVLPGGPRPVEPPEVLLEEPPEVSPIAQPAMPSFLESLPLTVSSIQFLQETGILQKITMQRETEDHKREHFARID